MSQSSRTSVFLIMLFYVCFNLSLYLLNGTQMIPNFSINSPENPEAMENLFFTLDLSLGNLAIGGVILASGFILGWVTGHLIYGGTLAIILFVLDLVFPVIKWLVVGIPMLMLSLDIPAIISVPVTVLCSFVFFWFAISLLGQRPQIGEG